MASSRRVVRVTFYRVKDLIDARALDRYEPVLRQDTPRQDQALRILARLGGRAPISQVNQMTGRRVNAQTHDLVWNALYERRLVTFPRDMIAELTPAGWERAREAGRRPEPEDGAQTQEDGR